MKNNSLVQKLELHAKIVKSNMKIPPKPNFAKVEYTGIPFRRTLNVGKAIIIAAVIVSVLTVSALAISSIQGWTFQDLLRFVFKNKDAVTLQEELENGEWVYLNGENIAVIVPGTPTKVLLTSDSGENWKESVVANSDVGYHSGRLWTNTSYEGGYIGFTNELNGYIALTTSVAAGRQEARFFITTDGGANWEERNNLNDIYPFVITGVGFFDDKVGFVSYRYYNEDGPIIWWTDDGCASWKRLEVEIPKDYINDGYRATPLSPHFDGLEGTYPIEVKLHYDIDPDPSIATIYMYSHDGGLTWEF